MPRASLRRRRSQPRAAPPPEPPHPNVTPDSRRDLIANVSHELRTPVAALHAQLENMVDGVIAPTPAALGAALAQTERLSRLVSYLLDLSRLEAGAAALNRTEIRLGDFLAEQAEELAMVEASKNLQYVVDCPAELTIFADRERLGQVVVNLLHNAIRHSPTDGEIRLDAYATETQVIIEVSDDGPGIAPADRERVFERFAAGTQTGTGGTGLGLAIVRWAAELHGGQVAVVDTNAPGATIRLTLPISGSP